ncbi:SGNH/GDSL hydrolase family protein [Malaciobacter mytili]|uniref:hypothetical protein n=1 Tax=Malaciobacter mytili TaxID=603050 RepID=UPI003BAF5020
MFTSKSIFSILKQIIINISIFILLIIFLAFLSITISYLYYSFIKKEPTFGKDFIAFENKNWLIKYFQEVEKVKNLVYYDSYVAWKRLPFKGELINITEEGIRKTPQHHNLKEDAKTVYFLGGSTMWGLGSSDKQTIPAYFSKYSKGNFKTVNLAEPGYSSFQEYITLSIKLAKGGTPDLVIMYDGVNQAITLVKEFNQFSHFEEKSIKSALEIKKIQDLKNITYSNYFYSIINPISKLLEKIIKKNKEPLFDLNEQRVYESAIETIESWAMAKQIANSKGSKFIAILQPVSAIGKPKIDHLNLDENLIETYKLLYTEIKKLLKTEKYKDISKSVYNLSNIFNIDKYLYYDYCHTSHEGNKIVAKKIIEIVDKLK